METETANENEVAYDALTLKEISSLMDANKSQIDLLASMNKKLVIEVERRLSDDVCDAYLAKGSHFGTVNIVQDGLTIVFDTPKKVSYDQDKLEAKFNEIRTAGQDPSEYIDVDYSISETKYKAWPEAIKNEFEDARTVEQGKMTVKFKK